MIMEHDNTAAATAGIVVYSVAGCPHCNEAKLTLRAHGLKFEEVRLDTLGAQAAHEVRDWLRARTGKTSVPQIFVRDRLIGGNSDLQALGRSPGESLTSALSRLGAQADP